MTRLRYKPKPCPFCGCAKSILATNGIGKWRACENCGASSGAELTARDANAAWNERATPSDFKFRFAYRGAQSSVWHVRVESTAGVVDLIAMTEEEAKALATHYGASGEWVAGATDSGEAYMRDAKGPRHE